MIDMLIPAGWRSWAPVRLIELGLCLAFLAFFYWPHPPASLLLLLVVAALAWIRIDVAVALLPLTFPYYLFLEPLRSSGSPAFSIGELGLLICLGVAVLRSALLPVDRRATWEWARGLWQQARPFVLPAIVFFVGASLALLVAPDFHDSLRAYRQDILEPLLYLLLLLRYLRTRADLARTLAAFVLSALIVASMGIIQGSFFRITYQVNLTTFRVRGPYGSPNNLGLFLDRAIPILLALAFTHLRQHPAAPGEVRAPVWRDPLRWLCLLATIPMLWALYWTDSRGAEVAIAVVVLLIFIFEVRQWIAIAAVIGVGAAGAWLFRARLLQLFTEGHQGTTSERFVYWKAALLMIRDHFFLGTGPGSFGILYNPDAPTSPKASDLNSYAIKALNGQPFLSTYDPGISHPHNLILDFWISTGLPGLAALFWLLGAFGLVLARLYRLCAPLRQGSLFQRLLLGLAGSMIAIVVHGLVDNSYFLPDLSMVFWLLIGALLIVRGIAMQELSLVSKPDLRQLAAMGQSSDPAATQKEVSIIETLTDTPGNASN